MSVRPAGVIAVTCSLVFVAGCPDDYQMLPLGTEIVLVALNEAHTGNLGGVGGADALCTQQAKAAGRKETFMAFLSASSRNVRHLIDPQMVDTVNVLNSRGETLYGSWRDVFASPSWSTGHLLYSFDGKPLNTSSGASPNWADGDGWHGSRPDGMVHSGMTCQDWTSGAPMHQGANGELDQQQLLKQEIQPCSTTLAVVCVGVGKAAAYGPCPTPGKPCKATDPCAVNPICGEDKICRPSHVLSCEDNLPCTTDTCDGKGGCKHTPKDGYCLINGQCHNDGAGDPSGCARCDSKTNKTGWTSLSGGCVIDGNCYKQGETDPTRCRACDPTKDANGWSTRTDPHCQVNGVCYDKDAKHPQACAHCDPSQSKTSLVVDANHCLIEDKCIISGATDPTGCRSCNPTSSKTSWTTDSDACVIDHVCRKKGDKHPGGCAECDPGTSQSAWTVVTTTDCLIDGGCHATGAKHPGGCAECQPATSKTSWTVTGAACLINGACHQSGALDPIGCYKCDPATSKSKWTAVSGCYKLVLSALNEAHTGSLGGISGADALCAKQAKAAGYAGTFKAFLSSAARNVKDLVSAANASQPVINTLGQQLYSSWGQVFTQSTFSGGYIYSFDGKKVDEGSGANPDWYDARNWHGSQMSGLVSAGQTCQDWTSALASHSGMGAELDMHRLLSSTSNTCNRTLAVVCVQTAAAP